MPALLHSPVLQGIGRGPTPDSAASKSLSLKPHKLRKGLSTSRGLSSSLVGSSRVLGWHLVSAATRGSHWLLLVSLQSKGGLCAPQSPCGCQQNWQREEPPLGCSQLLALTELTELEGNVWHTLPRPGISLCLRENSSIYDDLLFLSPWMIMINIPRAENIYLDHPYILTVLSPVK